MSEESAIEASDSEEIEIRNRINLRPYDMEPMRKCEHGEADFMAPCLSSPQNLLGCTTVFGLSSHGSLIEHPKSSIS